jgi:hypothetical protein
VELIIADVRVASVETDKNESARGRRRSGGAKH